MEESVNAKCNVQIHQQMKNTINKFIIQNNEGYDRWVFII